MSDRLRDLLRQRALLQEHLSWLDREIAAASDQGPGITSAPTAPTPLVPPSAALPPAAAVIATRIIAKTQPLSTTPPVAADAIIEKYRVAPDAVKKDVRRGCFLYFAAAFVLFALGVVALYFAISSR